MEERMAENKPLLICEHQEPITYLTLNRPEVLNALNRPLLLELKKELEKIRDDSSIRALCITGAGNKAFCAGADISFLNQATPMQVRELARLATSVTHLIENLGKVSVALINGFALGGGLELAESCMLRVAAASAKLGQPEVCIGAIPGWGGSTRLPRLIGKSRAVELLLTGRMIDAEEAQQIGLVHRTAPLEKLKEEGQQLLEQILANSPQAVDLTWQAVHRGLDSSIEESTRIGTDLFGLAASTDDFREGTKAFLEKRKAHYQNR